MGFGDKVSNAAEDATGKAKEAVGDATDNEDLSNEGRADQASATAKKVGENVKDAADNATDGVKNLFNK